MSRLDRRFPSLAAMERAAARRVPRFAFDFLQGGIGRETCLAANRAALDAVRFAPRYLVEPFEPDLAVTLFGADLPLPFLPAPVGLSGLMWPRAAELLATAATRAGLPVGLSSSATSSIEDIAAIAGRGLWFQLYCTKDTAIEDDLVRRAAAAGCEVLIVTVDIPTATRRERDIANGLALPPRFGLRTLLDIAARPAWAAAMLAAGMPRFRSLQPYVPRGASAAAAALFLRGVTDGRVRPAKLAKLRAAWRGRLVVKGVLTVADALCARQLGADAIVVSNHGGRQLDAAATAPEALPAIRRALGPSFPLLADGGVRSGLDVARLLACGADAVLMGRAFVHAVAAAGQAGAHHAIALIEQELRQTMKQIGCPDRAALRRMKLPTPGD